MRWVCDHCPVAGECTADVERQVAAGIVVVGFRAGESARTRTLRLRGLSDAQVLAGTPVEK